MKNQPHNITMIATQIYKATEPYYVDPDTLRVSVPVEVFAASELNGDAPCYLYDDEAASMGLECWAMVDGVDAHKHADKFDLWFASGGMRTAPKGTLVWVQKNNVAALGIEAPK